MRSLPTRSFSTLWHVGTLDKKDKGSASYEGSGLSVSTCPSSWRKIAKLGGAKTWSGSKENNAFVLVHSLEKDQEEEITTWGVKHGLVDKTMVWRVSWYNNEFDDVLWFEFDNLKEAEAEMDENRELSAYQGLVMTEALRIKSHLRQKEVIGAFEYLLCAYVEEKTKYDGVWWDDILDETLLSAPRGVILPKKVDDWNFVEVEKTLKSKESRSINTTKIKDLDKRRRKELHRLI